MRVDAASLGDVIGANAKPADWTFNIQDSDRVDVLIIAGHNTRLLLEQSAKKWLAKLLPAFTLVITEYGRRRLGDKEFFGFHDGVSQPAVRGITPDGDYLSRRVIAEDDPRSTYFAKPGQMLVWPGSFLFGYPGQSSSVTQAGATVQPPMPWMRNGSYLVFRRLLQDVVAFRNAVDGMEQHLKQQGEEVPSGWVAARLMGRWPDGTPLTASPTGEDTKISENPNRINNFRFFASLSPTPLADSGEPPQMLPEVPADPLGLACPRASHVRQVNPRDGISEIGQEHHPRKLMLRRGIAFGPEVDDTPGADRGLLFLSYQTSIVEQFKFVQVNWANATQRPTGDGRDPIIGQDGTRETKRSIQIFASSGRQFRCSFSGRWVIATGGEYFFTPSISGLKHLLGDQDGIPS
ncbi:Dyp-type peroxidase family protein [compost metagenome]